MTELHPVAAIRRTFERVLGTDASWLRDDDPLPAMGIPSITLITFIAQLQRENAITIPDDVIFSPTISLRSIAASLSEAATDAARHNRP